MFCNEEGLLVGLENCWVMKVNNRFFPLHGNLFVSRLNPKTGDQMSLDDKDVSLVMDMFLPVLGA